MVVWNVGHADFQPDPSDDADGSRITLTLFCGFWQSNAGCPGGTSHPLDYIPATPYSITMEGSLASRFGSDLWFPCTDDRGNAACSCISWGVVLGILPLTTAITSTIILRERPSIGFWICGVLGSAAVIIFSLREGGGSFQAGDWLLFGAVISASYGYVKGAEMSAQLGGWQTICWTLLSWSPILLPATLWLGQDLPEEVTWSSWIGFLYVALFSQFLGFFAWYKGLAMGGVARVSQTQLLMPFFVLFFSWLLLGEAIGWETFLFAGFVVGTVAIGKRMAIQR